MVVRAVDGVHPLRGLSALSRENSRDSVAENSPEHSAGHAVDQKVSRGRCGNEDPRYGASDLETRE